MEFARENESKINAPFGGDTAGGTLTGDAGVPAVKFGAEGSTTNRGGVKPEAVFKVRLAQFANGES